MTEHQPNQSVDILPVAEETNLQPSNYGLSLTTHVVLGIPVQSKAQAKKVTRLLWIAMGWMVMVSIDHSVSIDYLNSNSKDLYNCRQYNAAANGDSDKVANTNNTTYSNFLLAGYIISWVVAIAIPCIGYSGAKRRLRGHINVFRVFGGCFACISCYVTIDNFISAYRAANLSEDYFDKVHESCARLARAAELKYITFGVISLLLASTQCLAFGFASQIYNDTVFWTSSDNIRGIAGRVVPLNEEQMTNLEDQSHSVPFARMELQENRTVNLVPLSTSMTVGEMAAATNVNSLTTQNQGVNINFDGGSEKNESIPQAKVVTSPISSRRR